MMTARTSEALVDGGSQKTEDQTAERKPRDLEGIALSLETMFRTTTFFRLSEGRKITKRFVALVEETIKSGVPFCLTRAEEDGVVALSTDLKGTSEENRKD